MSINGPGMIIPYGAPTHVVLNQVAPGYLHLASPEGLIFSPQMSCTISAHVVNLFCWREGWMLAS